MDNTNGRAQINNLHIDHQVWGGGVGGEAAGLYLFKELRKRSGRVGFRWEVHVRVWTHLVLSSNHGQVTTVPIEQGVLLSFSSLNRIINASRIRYFFYILQFPASYKYRFARTVMLDRWGVELMCSILKPHMEVLEYGSGGSTTFFRLIL